MYKSFLIILTCYLMLADCELAPAYSTPWTVSLAINNNPGISSKLQHLCSGTIIDKLYVVTVAKCIKKIPYGSRIEIEAPSDDGEGVFINVPKQTRLVSEMYIKSFTVFENEVEVSDDEIVVLKLTHPLNFSNNIQEISIGKRKDNHELDGKVVYYYGWTEIKKRGMAFNAMNTEKRTIINESCGTNSTITTTITGECNNNQGQLGAALVQIQYGISRLIGMWISSTCSGNAHYATYVCMQYHTLGTPVQSKYRTN